MSHPQASGHESHAQTIKIEVVHNGVEKPMEARLDELVRAVLERAVRLFNVKEQPHILSLFRADGTRLEETETVKAAGLHNRSVVYLRPDVVKGG